MRLNRVLPFVVIALGLILIPRLAWWDQDPVDLELGVAGPPPGSCASHPPDGLAWILSHLKARPIGSMEWGLFPGALNPTELRGLSAVYLTGGLPCAMTHAETPEDKDPLKSLLGGWLRATDARALTGFISRGGAVIGEGGLLPAVLDAEALWRVEDCFRVRSTGWVGLSVDDIGDREQTPGWILERLRREGDLTTVSGPSVIFLKDDQILVLRGDLELEGEVHEIGWMETTTLISGEGISSSVPYRGWFEVVQPRGGCEVLAEHRIHVTEWGAQKLAAAGLSETSPCFIGYRGAHASYYIAASFSQDGPNDFWAQMAGYPKLASFTSSTFGDKKDRAFWEFYYPLMRQVILEAGRSWEKTGT